MIVTALKAKGEPGHLDKKNSFLLDFLRLEAVISLVMAERRYELDLGCYWWLYLIFIWYCPNFSAFLFHRIYAAYGGIFVVMELLWGLIFESVVPDTFDINSAAMACGLCWSGNHLLCT
jgi:drug/metabolite transporter superfamily protein YnfA